MVQTKEERNKQRREDRFARQHNSYQNTRWQIIHAFDKAQKEFWTHEKLLDYRNEWILNDSYKLLPDWVVERLVGVWDTCHDLLWRQLHVCYIHPDTGVLTRYVDFENSVDNARIDTESCKMCFYVDGKLHPFT